MSLRKLAITSALTLVVFAGAPGKASADWLFTPYIGWNWGGTAGFTDDFGDFEDEFERRANFGASLAWMGAGALGFEVDFGYSPNFFENTTGDENFQYGDRAARVFGRTPRADLDSSSLGSTMPTTCSMSTAQTGA